MLTRPSHSLRGLCAALMAALPLWAHALDYQVSIDTTPLAGLQGYLAFDLLAGTPGTVNDVVVSAFASTSTLDVAAPVGNVTGALPATVTLRSTVFFNELLQGISFAAGITSFTLNFSTNHLPGDVPDNFALFLLDDTLTPYATSDPTGALLAMDLTAGAVPQTYTSSWATVSVQAVPEPAAPLMVLAAAALLLSLRAAKARGGCRV